MSAETVAPPAAVDSDPVADALEEFAAFRADGLAAARLEELERARADLERERDGRRRDLIETAAGYVRTALPSSSTTAAETTRRTLRERVRDWLRW